MEEGSFLGLALCANRRGTGDEIAWSPERAMDQPVPWWQRLLRTQGLQRHPLASVEHLTFPAEEPKMILDMTG